MLIGCDNVKFCFGRDSNVFCLRTHVLCCRGDAFGRRNGGRRGEMLSC